MVEFAALEVTATAIWWQGGDTPLLMVAVLGVVVMVVENGKGRAWYFGFISSFMLAMGGAVGRGKGVKRGWRNRKAEVGWGYEAR